MTYQSSRLKAIDRLRQQAEEENKVEGLNVEKSFNECVTKLNVEIVFNSLIDDPKYDKAYLESLRDKRLSEIQYIPDHLDSDPGVTTNSGPLSDKKEYDVRMCKCGTIHFTEQSIVSSAITNNKDLLLICGKCGKSLVIGADKEPDWSNPESDDTVYNMYAYDYDQSFTTTEEGYVVADKLTSHTFSSNPIVRYSMGKRVMTMSGYYADSYFNDSFYDNSYPDLSMLNNRNCTIEEVRGHIEELNKNRRTVNMKWLLNNFTDDELHHLSRYVLSCFDWSGTKYETRYNSGK